MNCNTQCRNRCSRQPCCTRDYLPPFYCDPNMVVEAYNNPEDIDRPSWETPVPQNLWDLQQGCELWSTKYDFYKDNDYEKDCKKIGLGDECDEGTYKWCFEHEGECQKNLYLDESECCEKCDERVGYNCDPCHITPIPDDTCEATASEIGYCLAQGFGYPTANFNVIPPKCVECTDHGYDPWIHDKHEVPDTPGCIKHECSKKAGQFLNLMRPKGALK